MRILVILALLGATAAQAAGDIGPSTIPGDTREAKLRWIREKAEAADTNGDGLLTKTEWLAAGGKESGFIQLDTNRDDVLSPRELRSNARKLKAFEDFVAAPAY